MSRICVIGGRKVTFYDFDVKEREAPNRLPDEPGNFPRWVDGLIGIVYPSKPVYGAKELAYQSATADGVTYSFMVIKDGEPTEWQLLGGPESFLRWFARYCHHEYQYPAPYANPKPYGNWRPQEPLRELIRNHIWREAYVTDGDLTMADGRDEYDGDYMMTTPLIVADGRTWKNPPK
jgi:hypothetical protein